MARTVATPRTLRLAVAAALASLVVTVAGCSHEPQRLLGDLVLQDSTYLEPETRQPFSGDVVKYFDDEPDKVQLRGHLRDGRWNGEITVWHANGRLRYMGELADGEKCGAWTENQDPDPPGDVADQLRQEIASLGLYPPCPEG